MKKITCVIISVFENFLTRGKVYNVLDRDLENGEIKIIDDTENVKWFPSYCFKEDSIHVMKVKSFRITDTIELPYSDTVEVTLNIIKGDVESKRWCYFITPAYVYRRFLGFHPEPSIFGPHGIFIPVLSQESIKEAIAYLETEDIIEICTLPIK